MFLISIKATAVRDNGNGTFSIEMPGVELTTDQSKLLEQLFPNLQDAAWKLLNQEALLASIATQSEVTAPANPDYCNRAADQIVKKSKGNAYLKNEGY